MEQSEPGPGAVIRDLMRRVPRVGLGTVMRGEGGPYVSLAMVAVAHDASPLLLVSTLADHTKNLALDPRVSLLFDGTLDAAVPLAGARASVQGRVELAGDPALAARYVARHPDAAHYLTFGDFSLRRVVVERAHLVAGFGNIQWVEAADILFSADAAGALAAAEAGIVQHMNDDHGDAVQLYATKLLGLPAGAWRLTGVDPEGADLRADARTARLPFAAPAHDAEAARAQLVGLVRRARQPA